MNHEWICRMAELCGGKVVDCREHRSRNGISCHMEFPNGYSLSLQGGYGNYSMPREKADDYSELEMAVILKDLGIVVPVGMEHFYSCDTVIGYANQAAVESVMTSVSVLPRPNAVWLFLAIMWTRICHWMNVNIKQTMRRFRSDLRGRSYDAKGRRGLSFAVRRLLNYRRLCRTWRTRDQVRKVEELRKKETDTAKRWLLAQQVDDLDAKLERAEAKFDKDLGW